MKLRPIPRLATQQVPPSAIGTYGSNTAGRFLKDLEAGTDSLDIIVIGDSNAGFSENGYTGAWHRVMQFGLRVPNYATSLMAGSPTNQNALTTGNNNSGREMMWGLGVGQTWNAHTNAGGSNSPTTFKQMIQTAAADPAGEIAGLMSWLGFNSTNYNVNDTTNKMLRPIGFMNNPAVVEAGTRFTSSFNNAIWISNQQIASWVNFGSEMAFGSAGTGGHALQYRVVYGTFPTAGSFKPYSFYLGTTSPVLRDSATTSTGGGYGYATKAFDISSFTLASAGDPTRVAFTWDGANSATAADQANGPFACLWQSIVRPNFKGYAVSCLNYFGGLTTTQIAEKVEDCDKMLDAYLKEIRERQIASGGTGRAIVFCNSGINGVETGGTWTAGAQRIIDRISARWTSTGGNSANLAFVFTLTHPTTNAGLVWTANRPAVATTANNYAATNGSAYNLTVFDIAAVLSSQTMLRYSMYDSASQAHLTKVAIPPTAVTTANDGYQSITSALVNSLLSSLK
jgi:hypothetical protein